MSRLITDFLWCWFRLQQAENKIIADYKDAKVFKVVADLTSFESVRNAAAEIIALGEPIHVRYALADIVSLE